LGFFPAKALNFRGLFLLPEVVFFENRSSKFPATGKGLARRTIGSIGVLDSTGHCVKHYNRNLVDNQFVQHFDSGKAIFIPHQIQCPVRKIPSQHDGVLSFRDRRTPADYSKRKRLNFMKKSWISKSVFRRLHKRSNRSHKGQNGRVLILAGSQQFHGVVFFAGIAASRLVDLVFVATTKQNQSLAKKQSPEFIVTELAPKKLAPFLEKADSVLIGPGLDASLKNKRLARFILEEFPDKKTVLDATAFQLLSPKSLHANCCLTPHAGEFESFFGIPASVENAALKAKETGSVIVLKSHFNLVTNGKTVWKNPVGNAGLTTGGSGDILAGLIAGFAAKNGLLLASQAGLYLLGATADFLLKKRGLMFNAKDLLETIPLVFGKIAP
jgi:NAD(P)H-hydrate epimerase